MTYLFNRRKRLVLPLLALLMAGCGGTVSHRGYLPRAQDMQKVQVGMSKAEVEATMGSPSTTATINNTGDSYYYISSTVEQQAFFDPKETDRKVFAVRFNQNNQVESFANYGLEDGRIVDINSRETPTAGKELTILNQIFGNIGTFSPAQGPPGKGRVGQP
jgi:outer membrane protein assembly factor BamE (lipoprotein component of BamABCDE complex)